MNTSGYLTTSAFFVFLGPMEGDAMIHIDDRISEKNAWPEARWSHPMHQPQLTIGERLPPEQHAPPKRAERRGRPGIGHSSPWSGSIA
jgi:hypothetical protein